MPKQYPEAVRKRVVHLVAEQRGDYESEDAVIRSIVAKLGHRHAGDATSPAVRQAEVDSG